MPVNPNTNLIDEKIFNGLKELCDEGNNEFLVDVVNTYLSTAPEIINELQNAIRSQDHVRIERTAHKLKGCSRNVGIIPLCESAGELEQKAALGEAQNAQKLFSEIQEYFEVAKVQLQKAIAS